MRTFEGAGDNSSGSRIVADCFVQVLSAIFAERVCHAGQFTPFHSVSYREEPTLFVFVVIMSFVMIHFVDWVILGLIPKRDQQI